MGASEHRRPTSSSRQLTRVDGADAAGDVADEAVGGWAVGGVAGSADSKSRQPGAQREATGSVAGGVDPEPLGVEVDAAGAGRRRADEEVRAELMADIEGLKKRTEKNLRLSAMLLGMNEASVDGNVSSQPSTQTTFSARPPTLHIMADDPGVEELRVQEKHCMEMWKAANAELKAAREELRGEADEEVRAELMADIEGLKKRKGEWAQLLGMNEASVDGDVSSQPSTQTPMTRMVPVDSGYFLASGNTATCSAQGFFTTLGVVASTSYYAALAILYWLMIRPGWTERRLDRLGVKLSFLLPPAIVSFGFAIPPLFLTMYNHAGAYSCFIASKPLDCEMNSQVECERGDNAWIYWDVVWAYSMACGLAIIVFVSALVYTVFKQEKKTDKYLTPGQEKRRVNTIQTAWQGIRYVGAFLAAYITFYALSYYRHSERDPPIGLVYMHLILQPLLGLFNSFVYFRPRYLRHRARNPNDSWIISLGNVFNVDLDYLDSRRENLSRRISSISRKSVASLKLSSTISGGTKSERSESDSVEDSDLTSPLFRDSIEPNEDGVV